jgi:molybdopterin-guanine dinucleotide biosynthesis protein A
MVVACDMPLVDAAIFVRLLAWAKEATEDIEAIIPRIGGQAQPFHGLWHVRALPQMVAQIEMGELRLQSALARLRVCWPDEDALGVAADSPAFVNVNTPEEWARVRALLAQCDKPTT